MTRLLCSLSLDLDNQWSYMKTHGDAGWEAFPSYLDVVVPRFLDLLRRHGLQITVFVVGQDAALEKNREALRSIAAAGHEIGNHSFHHEPWLHRYSPERIADELARAEEAIQTATGERPRGFRGPGFSLSRDTLATLCARGYEYDASTFPSFVGPLARAYYFMTARLDREALAERGALFGSVRDGLRPLRPYRFAADGWSIVEIPVTTMPVFRVPIHVSYVQYLAVASRRLALAYFDTALAACRATRTELSLLLHPLDFLGAEDVPELRFFPAMGVPAGPKLALMDAILGRLRRAAEVVPMGEHARRAGRRTLRTVAPVFEGQPA